MPAVQAAGYVPTTTLGSIGLTENQQRTGDAVQTVCGQFIANADFALSPEAQDLFDRCGNMVHNANQLTGGQTTSNSLGLDQNGLAAAVMTVATEELAATKSMATELSSGQLKAGIARLTALRGGQPLAGLAAGFNPFASTVVGNISTPTAPRLRGGAAGDALGGDWAVFANASYGFGDRDATANEDGFDYDSWGLNVGADYRVNDASFVGALLSYGSNETDFDATAAVTGGGVDSDSWGISLYGTHYSDKYYVDGLIGYTHADYDINRRIFLPALVPAPPVVVTTDRTATGSTDSDGYTLSIGGGMDLQSNDVSYGPYARLSYQYTEVQGYAESGASGLNLTVQDQDWESLTSALGVRSNYPMSRDWGVFTPQVRVAWIHEFSNDSQVMSAFYTHDPRQNALTAITDTPDRNYFELGLGVSAAMQNGLQAFFDYQTLLGHEYVTDHVFTLGVRREM